MPPRSRLDRFVLGLLAVPTLLIAGAQVGRVPMLFDVLAVLQLHAAVVAGLLAFAALAMRRRRLSLAAAAIAAAGVALTPAAWTSASRPAAQGPTTALTLVSANLYHANERLDPLRAALLALDADIMATQETPLALLKPEDPLAAAYPHRRHWVSATQGGMAIWSRLPLIDTAPGDREGTHPQHLFASLALPKGGRLQIAVLHMGWSNLLAQDWTLADFNRFWRAIHPPTVVAGDFNAAPSSAALRRVTDITRTQVLGGWRPTWVGGADNVPVRLPWWAGLPVDHVAVSDGIGAEWARTAELPGSDHRAVVVRLHVPDVAP